MYKCIEFVFKDNLSRFSSRIGIQSKKICQKQREGEISVFNLSKIKHLFVDIKRDYIFMRLYSRSIKF